jgi:hypothetical protein
MTEERRVSRSDVGVRETRCMGACTLTGQVHRALCIMATVQRTCARKAERLSDRSRKSMAACWAADVGGFIKTSVGGDRRIVSVLHGTQPSVKGNRDSQVYLLDWTC